MLCKLWPLLWMDFSWKLLLTLKKSLCLVSSGGDEIIDGVVTLFSLCLISYSLCVRMGVCRLVFLFLILLCGVCSVML